MIKRCIRCGGETFRATMETEVWTFGGRRMSVEIPARKCVACGEGYFHGEDLGRAELHIAVEAARGPMNGPAFKFMRSVLGLRAADLGALLDVTPQHVSRWENDRRPIDRAAWVTLGTLVRERLDGRGETMERLVALRDGRASRRKRVRVKLAAA